LHADEEAVVLAWGGRIGGGVSEGDAGGACGVVADLHFLAAAVCAGVFVTGLALEARVIRMTNVEGHAEGLSNAADGGVELVADVEGVFFAEALDDAGGAGCVGEIAEWGELDPVLLAGGVGGELVWEEEGYGYGAGGR